MSERNLRSPDELAARIRLHRTVLENPEHPLRPGRRLANLVDLGLFCELAGDVVEARARLVEAAHLAPDALRAGKREPRSIGYTPDIFTILPLVVAFGDRAVLNEVLSTDHTRWGPPRRRRGRPGSKRPNCSRRTSKATGRDSRRGPPR